jgi:predicted ester cyclase
MATIQEITERGIAAFNQHDRAALEGTYASDAVCSAPGDMTFTGTAQILEFMQSWWTAFPDGQGNATTIHYSGDNCSIEEGVFEGTHDGVFSTPMGDIPPTHRKVRGDYVMISTTRGDKVVSQHIIFDRLQLMEQLGLVPTPAATA